MRRAVLTAMLVAAALSGCSTSEPIYSGQYYALSERNLVELTKEANAGSFDAAARVYEYYAFYLRDREESDKWYRRVEELRPARSGSAA